MAKEPNPVPKGAVKPPPPAAPSEKRHTRNYMKDEEIRVGTLIVRPKAFTYVRLAPAPVCVCGHTKLEHRIDRTCGKCLCIQWLVDE